MKFRTVKAFNIISEPNFLCAFRIIITTLIIYFHCFSGSSWIKQLFSSTKQEICKFIKSWSNSLDLRAFVIEQAILSFSAGVRIALKSFRSQLNNWNRNIQQSDMMNWFLTLLIKSKTAVKVAEPLSRKLRNSSFLPSLKVHTPLDGGPPKNRF